MPWTETRPGPHPPARHHRLGRLAALAVGKAVLVALPLAAAAIWTAVALTTGRGAAPPKFRRARPS